MTRTAEIRNNLRKHLQDITAADGEAWQVDNGWHTANHSITVNRRGVVIVRRFAGRTQEYHANMRLGDLDAVITELQPVDAAQLELMPLDGVPTPMTAAGAWRIAGNIVTAFALAAVLLAIL